MTMLIKCCVHTLPFMGLSSPVCTYFFLTRARSLVLTCLFFFIVKYSISGLPILLKEEEELESRRVILISHFSFIIFASSSPIGWSQPAGLLHVEATRSTCTPVWPLHLNPPQIQSQSLHWRLQRNHHLWWFPRG